MIYFNKGLFGASKLYIVYYFYSSIVTRNSSITKIKFFRTSSAQLPVVEIVTARDKGKWTGSKISIIDKTERLEFTKRTLIRQCLFEKQ